MHRSFNFETEKKLHLVPNIMYKFNFCCFSRRFVLWFVLVSACLVTYCAFCRCNVDDNDDDDIEDSCNDSGSNSGNIVGSDDSGLTDYELVTADTRNILFVGRSRTGKSTLIKVLQDKNYSPPLVDLMRGTVDVEVTSFTMRSDKYDNNLHFNILDTPGLFEVTSSLDDRRTNEVILDLIKKCVDREITKINHVYFVMSIESGLNPQDIKAFDLFSQLFIGMEDKLSIILSRAQTVMPENYNHFIEQFKTIPELKKIYDIVQGRIFFAGAAQNNSMYDMNLIRKNVYHQRSKLFEHIIQQTEWYNVKQLKVYTDNIKFLQTVQEKLKQYCKQIDNNQNNHDGDDTCHYVKKFHLFIRQYDTNNTINDG